MSGVAVDFTSARGEIRFTLPGNKGQFLGRMAGRNISGFWIAPPGDAGGPGQAFASPLVLMRTATDRWHGELHPLANVLNFYVKIFPDDKGLVGVSAIRKQTPTAMPANSASPATATGSISR